MKMTRILKRYMSGTDVRWLKERLFEMGFYVESIKKITHNRFGNDTHRAVQAFQRAHNLTVDGLYGPKSHGKMQSILGGADAVTEYVTAARYPRISKAAREAINTALSDVSEKRRKFVLKALEFATDASIADQFKYPHSVYIWGGNLYNKDLSINTITDTYLVNTYAKKNASYCTDGRLEMMRNAVAHNPATTGADCSGGIVGLMRYFGFAGKSFDTTANNLLSSTYSTAISKAELTAGDFIGKSGHICLYAGGGYMVEWAGGAYGCQLSKVADRRCWSYTKKKLVKLSACTKYRKPKMF